MMCETAKEKLVDKFYGDIVPKDLRQLEHHLASCSACQEEERALRMDLAQVLPLHSIDVARVMPDAFHANRVPERSSFEGWWIRFMNAPVPVYQVVVVIGLIVMGWSAGVWTMARVWGARQNTFAGTERIGSRQALFINSWSGGDQDEGRESSHVSY